VEYDFLDMTIRKLDGANMDIDLATPGGSIGWQQDACPWNESKYNHLQPVTLQVIIEL
jgi:hypothetical protein